MTEYFVFVLLLSPDVNRGIIFTTLEEKQEN